MKIKGKMKKLLSMVLTLLLIFCFTACGKDKGKDKDNIESFSQEDEFKDKGKDKDNAESSSQEDGFEEDKIDIEYYPNSSVPKLDFLLDEKEMNSIYHLYGPYDTSNDAKEVMDAYVSML